MNIIRLIGFFVSGIQIELAAELDGGSGQRQEFHTKYKIMTMSEFS